MSIKIDNKDSLEYLKTLEDKSINLAIYDAPYFSTKIKEVGDKQWKNEKEYIDWCLDIIRETQRVLKDNGSFYWFHNDINIMVDILYRVKNETEFKLKNQITWSKINNWKSANIKEGAGMYRSVLQCYGNQRSYNGSLTEYIYYFTFQDKTGSKQTNINNFKSLRNYSKELQNYIGLNIKGINAKLGNRRAEHFFYHSSTQWDICTKDVYDILIKKFNIDKWKYFKEYEKLRIEYENLRFPFNQENKIFKNKSIIDIREELKPFTTVWEYDRDNSYYLGHLTPKPLEMIKHIIEVSSNENDTVLDIFSGSGTTALASLITNRNFIGTEINKDYNNIAYDRINTYIKDNNLKNINIEIIK